MFRGCCGQPPRRQRRRTAQPKLKENPQLRGGKRMLFIGEGVLELRGAGSRLTYVVAEHRRDFTAHLLDVPHLLRRKDIILAP
jgi:hypothetical protein